MLFLLPPCGISLFPETGYVDSASSSVYKAGTMIAKERWKKFLTALLLFPSYELLC
jgi:hypothetical protein